jgi:hypothetical protein
MVLYIHTNSIIIKTTKLETGHKCILIKTTLVKMLESGNRYNIKVWTLMNQRPHRINLKYYSLAYQTQKVSSQKYFLAHMSFGRRRL